MKLALEETTGLDLEAIARRVLALSETAVAEHLASIDRSQAEALLALARAEAADAAAAN